MARLPTLFFDVGGVLLTNAWDTPARKRAAAAFALDYREFQTRHEMVKTAFETGRDRAMNVEPALALGLHAVQFQGLDALRDFLKERGIVV